MSDLDQLREERSDLKYEILKLLPGSTEYNQTDQRIVQIDAKVGEE